MNIDNISESVWYVGVDDRTKTYFENLWTIPSGVSYNSYLVEGTQATALIDGVESSEIAALKEHIGLNTSRHNIDFLVVNHMEPDHSGAVPALLDLYPGMKLIGNRTTLSMAADFYGIPAERMQEIKDGEILDLGGKTLQFLLTPMVHWPETMMTWLAEDGILFSGDAFGGFGALNGMPLDSQQDPKPYFNEIYRYYGCIVAKYGRFVQAALKKVGSLPIKTICATHSMVWRKHFKEVVDIYSRLSSWTPEEGTVIVYGTMYGNTQSMAEYLAAKVAEKSSAPVKVHEATYDNMPDILADIVRYRSIAIGTATYSMELFPTIETLMRALQVREIKNKKLCAFASYAWAPNVALKRFEEYAKAMNVPLLATAQMNRHRLEDCIPQLNAMADVLTAK